MLDECVTHDLRPLLIGHDVFTVAYMRWSGTKNGELLRRAGSEGFDALLTTDAAIEKQHRAAALPLPVVVLHVKANRIQDVSPLIPRVLAVLASPLHIGFHHVR